jgi:multisubunit Na+/H+ antiporter MnhG subunit
VLGAPLAVGPMLHLIGSLGLHRVPPMFRARGGYKSFLATIGRHASTIVNSLAVVLPFSNRGRSARQKPVVDRRL